MRSGLLLCLSSLLQLCVFADISPFHQPSFPDAVKLAKRQGGCASGYTACVLEGAPNACCQPDTVCSRDAARHIACCPRGAICTGFVSGILSPSTTGFLSPVPGSTTAPSPITSTVPQPPTITITRGPTITDAPFTFSYIPTTFRDQAECLASYTACQSQLSVCQQALAGRNGITIGGPISGFGTTVQAMPTSQAQSICASLHNVACYGLLPGYCTVFPGGAVLPGGTTSTNRHSTLYEMLTGLIIALVGMIA